MTPARANGRGHGAERPRPGYPRPQRGDPASGTHGRSERAHGGGGRVRLGVAAMVIVAASVLGPLASPAVGGGQHRPDVGVGRVLVFSLPFISWENLDTYDAPNLERFLDHAAIAGLTTRADERVTKLADGYLTFGAGTRAAGDPSSDGDALGADERFGRDRAADVYFQRTGRSVSGGIVSLAMPRVVTVNDSLLYDAELGALAIALRDAGVRRSVVANADGRQPDSPPSPQTSVYRRQAALSLVDARGRLPAGRVDNGLLADDPVAPYGLRLDRDAVVEAFRRSWTDDRAVVVVEASDIVRADAYRAYASPVRKEVLTGQALHHSDRLFGRLLEQVDPKRDAVLVMGPAHSNNTITLTVLGLQAPGVEPGLLRSATTRRSGFVQLIDVAPTILALLDVERPTSMEGRPVEVGTDGGSAPERRELIVHADEAAQFRDLRVGEIQTAFVVFAAALVLATFLAFRRPRPPRWRDRLGTVALCVLGFVPATFLARLAPLHEWGFVPYWAAIVAIAVALGAVYHRVGRDRYLDGLLIALLVPVVLLLLDVLVGTPLEFNSALGYSPTVAGRFTGFSNPAYAIVAACSVIAASLLAHRIGGRRGAWTGITLLAVVIVVDGAPFWGSDVGGILSMVPAFGVTAVLLLGWRVRWGTVLWCVVGVVVALGAATALDMSRPPERRTHLGRLVERIDDRGIGDFIVVVQRKLADNLGSLGTSVWGFMLPIALVLALWLIYRAQDRLRAVVDAVPEIRAGAVGLAIVAVLGWALNDSGIAIPGIMIAIAIATLVWLLVRTDLDRPPPRDRPDPPIVKKRDRVRA